MLQEIKNEGIMFDKLFSTILYIFHFIGLTNAAPCIKALFAQQG